MKELWSFTRRCYTDPKASPLPDRPRRDLGQVYHDAHAGDDEIQEGDGEASGWQLDPGSLHRYVGSAVATSIEERRRNRWMAIPNGDGGFYDDVFGGRDWRRRETAARCEDDWKVVPTRRETAARCEDDWKVVPRPCSGEMSLSPAGAEDRGLRACSSRSFATVLDDDDDDAALRSSSKLRPLTHSPPSPTKHEEVDISQPSSWLRGLDLSSSTASRPRAGSRRHEPTGAAASSMRSLKKEANCHETDSSNETNHMLPKYEQLTDRRIMSIADQMALEDFERAVVVDVDDLNSGDGVEDEDEDESFVIEVCGKRRWAGETEGPGAVDEAIAWAREQSIGGDGRK